MIVFEELKVSDTVSEFRSFISSENYTLSTIAWLLPCALLSGLPFLLPSIVATVFVGLVYFFTLWSFISQVTEESVLIIKDFGIQLRVLYRSGSEETKFLDKDKIVGVIVHETIVGSRIRYELAFLMRDEAKLSLSFTYLYPGLADLRKVYKACADMSGNPRARAKCDGYLRMTSSLLQYISQASSRSGLVHEEELLVHSSNQVYFITLQSMIV